VVVVAAPARGCFIDALPFKGLQSHGPHIVAENMFDEFIPLVAHEDLACEK
jgi:hypothetical protein